MTGYDFRSLSPLDFEDLSGDLVERTLGERLSRYKPGRDGGIDVGNYTFEGESGLIVQCKHYVGTGFAGLLRDLKNIELPKLEALKPSRYIVATSVPLNPSEKSQVSRALSPFVLSYEDVLGQDDLNSLLRTHDDIERKHFKLWLSSASVLRRMVNGATYERSTDFLENLGDNIARFVASDAVLRATAMLDSSHVCLIAGVPGIGKTLLAQVLCSQLCEQAYEVVVVSADVKDAEAVWDGSRPQVFYYDDFLGSATLEGVLGKNEDTRLLSFMSRVARTPDKKMVLTTREYILAATQQVFDKLHSPPIELHKVTLALGDYTRMIRAKILFNHLWFADVDNAYFRTFVVEKAHWTVINHRNYSPRLISNTLELAQRNRVPSSDFPEYFESSLNDPAELWTQTYESQLTSVGRAVLVALLTLDSRTTETDLWRAVRRQASEFSGDLELEYSKAIKALEGTFTRSRRDPRSNLVEISFSSPSVADFMMVRLARNGSELEAALNGCSTFDQIMSFSRLLSVNRVPSGGAADAHLATALADVRHLVQQNAVTLLALPEFAEADAFDASEARQLVNRCSQLIEVFGTLDFMDTSLDVVAAVARRRWSLRPTLGPHDVGLAAALFGSAQNRELRTDVVRQLKQLSQERLHDVDDWEACLALTHIDGLFEEEEIEELQEEFETFVYDELESLDSEEPEDIDELEDLSSRVEQLRSTCDEFSVETYRLDDLETKFEELREKIPEPDYDYEPDDRYFEGKREAGEIDRMFGQLL